MEPINEMLEFTFKYNTRLSEFVKCFITFSPILQWVIIFN